MKPKVPSPEVAAAREAGLHYVSDTKPGITRRRVKGGFRYLDARGKNLREAKVVQRIKAAHPLMSVVALSGYGSPEDKQRAEAAGFDAHLVKPVEFDVLKALMNRC